MNTDNPHLEYIPLEKVKSPKPVHRLRFVKKQVEGKTILDLGALDETAYKLLSHSESWLHRNIAETAKYVYGIDSSSLIDGEGLHPFPNSIITKGDVMKISEAFSEFSKVDIVVAGELIEHVPDASAFLNGLKNVQHLQGKELIITTPNACSLTNFLIGLLGRESMHKDHLNIFSYKTLNTLFMRANFESWQIMPYYVSYNEMKFQSGTAKRTIVNMVEKTVNLGERLFPLVSCGWVCVIKI